MAWKTVSRRLTHKLLNCLYEPFQSAYRPGHSTETAVLHVQNDILRELDNGKGAFLVLLDLPVAFDTVSLTASPYSFEATFKAIWVEDFLLWECSICEDTSILWRRYCPCMKIVFIGGAQFVKIHQFYEGDTVHAWRLSSLGVLNLWRYISSLTEVLSMDEDRLHWACSICEDTPILWRRYCPCMKIVFIGSAQFVKIHQFYERNIVHAWRLSSLGVLNLWRYTNSMKEILSMHEDCLLWECSYTEEDSNHQVNYHTKW